jgi:hypothetical protein
MIWRMLTPDEARRLARTCERCGLDRDRVAYEIVRFQLGFEATDVTQRVIQAAREAAKEVEK